MPTLIIGTVGAFTEIANSFGFSVAVFIVISILLYKIVLAIIKHLQDEKVQKESAYDDLVKEVQENNKIRESKYEKTIEEISEKSEKRDAEYILIIKNLSENFSVLKEVLVKVEGLESEIKKLV